VLNVDKLTANGWRASVDLDSGIKSTYEWFLQQISGGETHLRGY
jgi:nucleoside-diphosphate-sugar epimerase